MSAAMELREHVFAVVRERGPIFGNAVVKATGKRKADVLVALRELQQARRVARTREGYKAVPTAQESVPRPVPATELREPACRNAEHRGRDWAMPGATVWICGVCHPPSDVLHAYGLTRRADRPEARQPPEPVTFAAAIHAWQRRADQ